jgi:hypothetical protein
VNKSTEALIDGLTDRLLPVSANHLQQRLGLGLAAGAMIMLTLVIGAIGLRPDLAMAASDAKFWVKIIYTGTIAAIAIAGARQLARPEVSKIRITISLAPIGIVALFAALELSAAEAGQHYALIFGQTWRECPLLIAGLSLPLLAILMRLFTGFAPQRPRLTGAVIGVTAGGTAAMLYSLHCPEMAMTFLLIWYSIGITVVGAIGALIGPGILRW